jgi:enoyl-CoA hydratase/carnithine racemase
MTTTIDEATTHEPYVVRRQRSGVLTLTLNRGARFNPLSIELLRALDRELVRIGDDESVRVVVLEGAGRGFSAGHDLGEMREHLGDDVWQQELFDTCSTVMVRLTRLPQPVIAKVHGIATAAGCQLVSMCDLAVASDDSRFGLPGVNIGVFCSTPAVGVARNIGRKRAMELLLTGEMVDAATAQAWGLINTVVPAADLDAAVARFTDVVVARSAPVIANGKRTFYAQLDEPLGGAYDVAGRAMVTDLAGEDAGEGIAAFLGKRPAEWPSARRATPSG